ncbi:hypothetical protein FACS189425_01420 [Clostridia bacterium]|nr:hypothetical protein FACS189425_01420 [Clostridia bacterium]
MLNKAIIMGRLTRDPEFRATPNGASVCNFSVAVDRRFVRQGEERQTDFINCVAWRQTAEFVNKYFTKGRMINVVGSIQTRTWTDTDGKKRYATDVVADEVNFCGEKRSDGDAPSNHGSQEVPDEGFMTIDADDDLPF